MPTVVNPILSPINLLKPTMPGVYDRAMIYDPTYDDPAYTSYSGQRIVPAVTSLVKDGDGTLLWVTAVDSVSYIPSYQAVSLSNQNENVVSLLDYGASILRLFTDNRSQPYVATPDSKCVVIGKSPRYYTLTRKPGTNAESVISQYYDATNTLVSQHVPLVALDSSMTSWYLPRCHVSAELDLNEEVQVTIYNEDGLEVYSALLFAKESAVINENVLYSPTIVGMNVTSNQKMIDGTFFVYEKQNFDSLGLTITIVYDDGTTQIVPIDGVKCVLYGESDFIASYAGLKQTVIVKYFRSQSEAINPSIADETGQMISLDIPITVIPNTLGTTNKVLPIPTYNTSLARYIMRYWMYFADGRTPVDVSAFTTISIGSLVTDSSYFGIQQSYTISVDMHAASPTTYPTDAVYQQSVVITFNPPSTLVRWTIKDAIGSPYIMGQDNNNARRAVINYDSELGQYFIPSTVFANQAAFIKSFYTQTSPPYDPTVSQIPQTPTHFILRDVISGAQLVSAPIPVANYTTAFNIINDSNGNYNNTTVVVEFINRISSTLSNVLFAIPVEVKPNTYV